MTRPYWQPQSVVDAVIFDCDGTLTTLEGIDVLAEHNGVGEQVCELTEVAMNTSGVTPDMYTTRLKMVSPTHEQVQELGQEYYANRIDDTAEVIKIFRKFKKDVYIVSAGLYPAVKVFGEMLEVPDLNIFAVDIYFDEAGNYQTYEHDSPMVHRNGKRVIVSEIKKTHKNIVYTGDGVNDIEAQDLVERFVGFGGKFYRGNIADYCDYYIGISSMAPMLALSLTHEECEKLTQEEKIIYDKGIAAIRDEKVLIRPAIPARL